MPKPFVSGDNVYNKCLIQVLSELPLPFRPIDKPLRVNITNFYESPGGKIKGHCISGKIEGGVLRKD
jgi:translation elongation factor EF-1alpha